MNAIRLVISIFLVVLIGVATTGWIWTGRHQTAAQSAASRVVLTVCIAAGVLGLAVLWRTRKPH
jgi:hypothetical protein